jgi:hypothetical protein
MSLNQFPLSVRNQLSDMNLLQYANISGETFTFNIVNQE